jgi:hypothetical protein
MVVIQNEADYAQAKALVGGRASVLDDNECAFGSHAGLSGEYRLPAW